MQRADAMYALAVIRYRRPLGGDPGIGRAHLDRAEGPEPAVLPDD